MSRGREIRSFDYVNHPYEKVRDALSSDAVSVFRSATKAAASRARSVAAELHVNVAGIDVGKEISISVHQVEEKARSGTTYPVTHLDLEWEASESPGLFPVMSGQLSIYPLTATETQLDFRGNYEPPLGWLGSAVNALVGHRIAEASVHRFVSEVAVFLRTTLAP